MTAWGVLRQQAFDDSAICGRLQGFPEDSGLLAWVKMRWVEGDPSSLNALRAADLGAADSFVIGDSGEGPAKEADALMLTTIALAQVPRSPPSRS